MSRSLYCNHCGAYVGDCGHEPGVTGTVTLSGTCRCGREFSVSCNGNCLKESGRESAMEKLEGTCKTCKGHGVIVKTVTVQCGTCDGSGTVLERKCQTCHGKGTTTEKVQEDCPDC